MLVKFSMAQETSIIVTPVELTAVLALDYAGPGHLQGVPAVQGLDMQDLQRSVPAAGVERLDVVQFGGEFVILVGGEVFFHSKLSQILNIQLINQTRLEAIPL